MISVLSICRPTIFVLLFVAVPVLAGPGADGIELTVDPAVAPGELALSWSGGQQPYLVHRSSDPTAVIAAGTRVSATTATNVDLPAGAPDLEFFLVVNVNAASNVASTSDCLTSGTGAQSEVVVELQDTLGNPLPGATVIVTTDQGSLGPVTDSNGTYRAVLTAPAVTTAPATIGVTSDGVPLTAVVAVEFDDPLTATGGGAGGCPADGNLRVRVVDESGAPLDGARVMVGVAEAPGGSNTGLTDSDGYFEFVDVGVDLDGPLTVTAADDDRRYVTFVEVDASDVVIPLPEVDPLIQGEVFTGDVTNVPAPNNDPIELAVMLPDVTLDAVLSFSANDLLSDSECYDAGGVAGASPVPGNIYIPGQCALSILFCLQSLPEHEYTSGAVNFGDRRLLALRGDVPLSSLTSGDFNSVLSTFSLNGIGVVPIPASNPGPTPLNLPVTQAVTPNLDCTIDNAPTNSDVFCVAAGDWDSATATELVPGEGRLFVTGFELGDAALTTGPFTISGVTTVNDTGDFAGIDYLGGAIAQYNDPLKPGIPLGTVDGSSAILERSGVAFDGAGGSVTFSDFFPIRTLSRAARDFGLSALPGTPHPAPHLTRVSLDRIVTETYTACILDDSTRTRRTTLWEIYLPGSSVAWQLPTPPAGWPRQGAGGDLAGLIDPAATPEDDLLVQVAATLHLGTLPAFDYDRLSLEDIETHLTHVTRNTVDY